MAKSSIAGGSIPPEQWMRGKDIQSLGPGDSSDTGSDTLGAYSEEELASDSDAVGTGERAGVIGNERPDADILPDRAMDEADFLEEGEGAADEDPDARGEEGEATRAAGGAGEIAGVVADEDEEDETDEEEGEYGEGEDGDPTVRGGGA